MLHYFDRHTLLTRLLLVAVGLSALLALAAAGAAAAWIWHHDARTVDEGEFSAMIDGGLRDGASVAEIQAFLRDAEERERDRITVTDWPPETLESHSQLRCTGRPVFASAQSQVIVARVNNKYHGLSGLYSYSFGVMFVLDESGSYAGHRVVESCPVSD